MSINASGTISLVWNLEATNMMTVKLSSVVMVLMMFFIAKISFESATAENVPQTYHERSPASIDQSYNDHMAKR